MIRILITTLLIVGLIVGVLLVGRQTGFFSKADISTTPQEIKVSNIADNSFTVSWITAKPVTGFVQYGETESLGETASDDRDSGSLKPRLTHHATLRDLTPSKTYYLKINNGNVFTQVTAPVTQNPPAVPEPIFGKLIKPDGAVAEDNLVYLQINEGSLLSSYVRNNGNWLITLNNARTKELSNYLEVSETSMINISVSGDGKAVIQAKLSDVGVFSKITLSQNTSNTALKDLNGDGVINIFDRILSTVRK